MYSFIKQIAIIGLFLLTVLTAMGQDANYVLAFGKLKIEWGNTDNTKITLFEDDKQIDTYSPESSGKFQFSLELNHLYMFWFAKPGHVTKKVQFDTHVPATVTSDPEFIPFPDFDFYVTLFESYPDVDTMFFTKPVGKIQFNASLVDFDWDKDYTLEIQRSMEQIEKELSEKHNKQIQEKEEKEKLAAQQENLAKEAKKQSDMQLALEKEQQEKDAKQKEKEKQEAERLATLETAKKLADINAEQERLDKQTEAENKAAQKTLETEKTSELPLNIVSDGVKTETKSAEAIILNEEPVKVDVAKKSIDENKNTERNQVGIFPKGSLVEEYDISASNAKKVEKVEVAGKTTTRTQITENEMTLTYIKVEYTWGGKFYFIEDENNVFRNISENYYNTMLLRKK